MSLINDALNKAALARINVDANLHQYNTGAGVKIGIVSDGLALHTAYKDRIKGGWDFVNNQAVDGSTNGGIGTFTAGLIAGSGTPFKASAANGPSDISILGVAPGAYLYDLKVFDSGGAVTNQRVADAINWAVTNNLEILVLQVGWASDYQNVRDAVTAAYNAGIIMFAPVGSNFATWYGVNQHWPSTIPQTDYPAALDNVIGVAEIAHTTDGPDHWRIWWDIMAQVRRTIRVYHARDGGVDLVAPGGNTPSFAGPVGSTYGTDSTSTDTGTHVATALTAGVAALVIQGAWVSGVNNIKQRLLDSATALTSPGLGESYNQKIYGSGLINAVVAAPPQVFPLGLQIADIKTLLDVGSDGIADATLVAQYGSMSVKEFQELFTKPSDSTDLLVYLDARPVRKITSSLRNIVKQDPIPYTLRYPYPKNNATNIPVGDPIKFTLVSDTVGIDINTVKVDIDGTIYQKGDSDFTYTGDRTKYEVSVRPQTPWGYEQTVNVEIEAWDLLGKPGLILERMVT